ncbi:MAG: helix-turn-helix domain-containing protein [Alcanivorax sp.]|nr:helix-turn-helix domain-containing protein [Alcanivorax sp.]
MPKLTDLSGEALHEELGARLKRRRVQEKLTQSDLADKAKVSRTTLTKIENGRNVGLAEFLRVADALGLLGDLDSVISMPEATPLDLLRGKKRQTARVRVRPTGGNGPGKTARSRANNPTPPEGTFVWPEDR